MRYTTTTLVFVFVLAVIAVTKAIDDSHVGVTNALLSIIICLLYDGNKK